MGDYIRGKKAYTKWDADSENVDIEYRHDSHKLKDGWLSGSKGKVIKILLVLLAFNLGLVLGYLIRRGVHEVILQKSYQKPAGNIYEYNQEIAKKLRKGISGDSIKDFLRSLSTQAHIAGTLSNHELAQEIRRHWRHCGLDNVYIDRYSVLLSHPSDTQPNYVTIMDSKLQQHFYSSQAGDDASHPELKPFAAFSPSGNATGELIYANYGSKADFDYLKSLNVTVKGSIVIMRLGKVHRANKVKFAEDAGAVGVILYPDPADYVARNAIFPHGVGLPGDSIVRGTLLMYPGDPETPFGPSTDDAYRIPLSEAHIPKIPVQPISYNDARELLSNMDGPEPPEGWRGGLNESYHVGPGYISSNITNVTIQIFNKMHAKSIYNVIGVIHGRIEPDRYVILGCHHDSWTNGASDPGTGLAVFMELVRSFGELHKETGWRPARTLVFASWDAEEYGMIGSTEWVQDHEKELIDRAVAYINIDAAVSGNYTLHALASPFMRKAIYEATKEVPYQEDDEQEMNSVYDIWKMRNSENYSSTTVPRIDNLGTGSDFISFMASNGIPSIHLQYIDNNLQEDYPLYHTAYDSFEAINYFVDPDLVASISLARVVASLALKLSESLYLPFSCHHYALSLQQGVIDLKKQFESLLHLHNIRLDSLEGTVNYFEHVAKEYHNNFDVMNDKDELLAYREYNDNIIQVERAFLLPSKAMGNNPYRHAIFGPHPHNIYVGIYYPGIQTAALEVQDNPTTPNIENLKHQISYVVQAVRSAIGILKSSVLTDVGQEPLST